MNTIAELEPEKFEQIIQQYPRFVGRDKKRFRAIRELSNGAFIEVNLSAPSIQRFCVQAMEAIDLTTDDWKVEGESLSKVTPQLDDKSFIDYLAKRESPEVAQVAQNILDWITPKVTRVWWGKGGRSFVPVLNHNGVDHQLFAVRCEGKLETYFYWFARKPPFSDESLRITLMEKLNQIPGVQITRGEITNKMPKFPLSILAGQQALEIFKATYEWVLDTIST